MSASANIARERLSSALATDRAIAAMVVRNAVDYQNVSSSDRVRMCQIFGDYTTASGAVVNEHTAMRVSAVYAAVRLIAGAVATTPCSLYRRTEEGREKANDHDYWWLFNEQPCPRFTAATFWEYITSQTLLRGDAIAYLQRGVNRSPTVIAVIPVPRDSVNIIRKGQRLVYQIMETMADGTVGYFTADQDDVLHFPGFGFDGTTSKSIVGWAARQAIGIAIKADEHAAQMFGSGASIQYAVKTPNKMAPDQQDRFREAWVAKYSGNGVAQTPLVLTEGLEVQELSMTAVDAQLLESRRFNVVDIARAVGVPPHMIGETTANSSWGTGIEQMSLGFVKWALRPHLNRFRQELNRKLFPKLDRYFFEFNVDGLLEGDSKAQAEYFAKALGGPGTQGWMAVDEVRRLKNLPPMAGEFAEVGKAGAPPATPAPNEEPDLPDEPTPPEEDAPETKTP